MASCATPVIHVWCCKLPLLEVDPLSSNMGI